jgi:hypothetical protein
VAKISLFDWTAGAITGCGIAEFSSTHGGGGFVIDLGAIAIAVVLIVFVKIIIRKIQFCREHRQSRCGRYL